MYFIIGGSLNNIKQSTILSEYITAYAQKKAIYNGDIRYYKTLLSKKIYWWVGGAMFISNEVLKMEELK
jgi:hypothetical protein